VVLDGFMDCSSCLEGSCWTRGFRSGEYSLLLLWLLARGWVSLDLEFFGFLDLLVGLCISSVQGILQFLLEFFLLHLQVLGFLLLHGLGDGGNFGGVGLGFLCSVFDFRLLFHQGILLLLESLLVLCLQGVLSFLSLLVCLVKLLSFFLSLFDNDVEELVSFLNSDLHLGIKTRTDLGGLLLDNVFLSVSGSGKSLISDSADSLGLFELPELLGLGLLLLNGFESLW